MRQREQLYQNGIPVFALRQNQYRMQHRLFKEIEYAECNKHNGQSKTKKPFGNKIYFCT